MGEQKYSYMGRQRDCYMIDTQTDRDRLRLKEREATRQADKEIYPDWKQLDRQTKRHPTGRTDQDTGPSKYPLGGKRDIEKAR